MMIKNKNNMRLLKYLTIYTFIVIFIILITNSRASAQWSPYSSYGFPYVTAPPPDFSGYIWNSPTTAYNPNTPPGITQRVFVDWTEGGEWQSPYYQQAGYNINNPFSGYSFPYNGLMGYPYNVLGGYGQSFLNNWFNPWQQSYQNFAWGLSYPFGGYFWNSYTPQFLYNYNGWNPWQSWPSKYTDEPTGYYGKPAIYLYPQKDTYVSVELDIDGEITKTIPLYNDGWYVLSKPDGTIIDESQGNQSYDYLFWEAEPNLIELPDEGWIVAQKDLEKWFHEYLPKLGLNKKEKEQFMEYWLERLQGKDYYEMKLLSHKFLEEHATLSISPTPDTVIRVIFYFTPLDEYKVLKTPVIETPERKGFVALEWGGILGE